MSEVKASQRKFRSEFVKKYTFCKSSPPHFCSLCLNVSNAHFIRKPLLTLCEVLPIKMVFCDCCLGSTRAKDVFFLSKFQKLEAEGSSISKCCTLCLIRRAPTRCAKTPVMQTSSQGMYGPGSRDAAAVRFAIKSPERLGERRRMFYGLASQVD